MADTNADHIVFEDTLIPLDLEGYSQLMLVITGNGSKEWIWYARDFDDWIGRLNAALSGHPVYPIDIEYQLDPEMVDTPGVHRLDARHGMQLP